MQLSDGNPKTLGPSRGGHHTGTIPAPNTESESGPAYWKSPAGSYPSPWDNTGSACLRQEGRIA